MKQLPVMKREVAVASENENQFLITFYSTRDALADIQQFGEVYPFSSTSEKYFLYVDRRFDFADVLAYIENYGEEDV